MIHNNGYTKGQTAFYGFAFRLQSDWQFSPAQTYNLAQFIGHFPGTCDEDSPTSMIWVNGNQLYSRIVSGDLCSRDFVYTPSLGTIQAGLWNRVEIQANWQTDNTGYYKVWLNGDKVYEKYNIPTTINRSETFQFRVGLYANGWHDDGTNKGTQNTRQVWYDEVGIGSTFADADPNQW